MDILNLDAVPWNGNIYPEKSIYYAYGNTPMFDIMSDMILPERSLDILLLGASDVRNVLYTVKKHQDQINEYRPIVFHLNDVMPAIVARNVLLLEIIATINPSCKDDMDFLWAVWYNVNLSEAHYQRLVSILDHLVSVPFRPSCHIEYGSQEMLQTSRDIWLSWKNLADSIPLVMARRHKDFTESEFKNMDRVPPEHLLNCIYSCELNDFESWMSDEIALYHERGLVVRCPYVLAGAQRINPTMWVPPYTEWNLHVGLEPYSCYSPLNKFILERKRSIVQSCILKLKSLVEATQVLRCIQWNVDDFCNDLDCTHECLNADWPPLKRNRPIGYYELQFKIWEGEAMNMRYKTLPLDLKFDFVYTSNIVDVVGLLNVLIVWSGKLKTRDSVLYTESMNWYCAYPDMEGYITENVPISSLMLPLFLRLHLANDLDLGNSARLGLLWVVSSWRASVDQTTPFVIGTQFPTKLYDELYQLSRLCFSCEYVKCNPVAKGMASPWTFIQILKNLSQQLDMSTSHLLSLVESMLPVIQCRSSGRSHSYFYETWKGLLSMEGMRHSDVVSVSFLYPQKLRTKERRGMESQCAVVLFECIEDASHFFTIIKDIKAGEFSKPFHIFHNFLFDAKTDTVTIFMEETLRQRLLDSCACIACFNKNNIMFRFSTPLANTATRRYPIVQNVQTKTSLDVQSPVHITKFTDSDEFYEIVLTLENETISTSDIHVGIECDAHTVSISVKRERFEKTLNFTLSCPVLANGIKKRSTRRGVKITIRKFRFLCVGEGVIQRKTLTKSDLKPIADIKGFMPTLLLMFISTITPEEVQRLKFAEKPSDFFELRLNLKKMFMSIIKPFPGFWFHTGSPNLGRGIWISVLGFYIYKDYPLLRVSWIDTHRSVVTPQQLTDTKKSLQGMIGVPENIQTSNEVISMLGRLLLINARRVQQPEGAPVDGRYSGYSFFQLRFHQQSQSYSPDSVPSIFQWKVND